jgi:hypothetical protein
MPENNEQNPIIEVAMKQTPKTAVPEHLASAIAKVIVSASPATTNLASALLDIREMRLSPEKREERRKTIAEETAVLVKALIEAGIDPVAFDALISNEINRRLKVRFGGWFLFLTFLFTAASYSIVILDGIYKWNISQVAITALIIETPIQFIGLLYIIARNLFPRRNEEPDKPAKLTRYGTLTNETKNTEQEN